MAIYGDLEYHAFSDIIKVLQRHTGVLFMRTALAGRSVELHLNQGTLGAMFIDGFPVSEPLRVRDTIRSLINAATGEYSFEAGQTSAQLALPIADLISEVLTTADIPEAQLPHPETRFEWQLHGAPPQVPASLKANWDAVAPILRRGASATELASELRISVQEARIVLYRLRAAGLATPMRAAGVFQERPSTPAAAPQAATSWLADPRTAYQQQAQPQPQQNVGPVRRLLNALRRLTGGQA